MVLPASGTMNFNEIFEEGQNIVGNTKYYELEYTVTFSEADLIFDTVMGYDIVRLQGNNYINELGKPMLSSSQIQIALPSGITAEDVHVVDTKKEEISGTYNIFPAQRAITTDSSYEDIDFMEPDSETYLSAQPYPSKLAEFSHQGDLAGQNIAVIQLYPLQYIPYEKKLILYTSITFTIKGINGHVCGDYHPRRISQSGRETYEKMLMDMVINPEDVEVKTSSGPPLPPGDFDYVIITSSSLVDDFQPLANWKKKKGVPSTIVTTDHIYATYPGTDNKEKIRNFIIDMHANQGSIWFLLGGDVNQVPVGTKVQTWPHGDIEIPTDMYYSDFDDDWYCEVFTGRASVENSAEVSTFIDKVLTYEQNPPIESPGYPTNAALFGFRVGTGEDHAKMLMEYIDTHYIPPVFDPLTKIYEDDLEPMDYETLVIDLLNAGQHLIPYLAPHGDYDLILTGQREGCSPDYDNIIYSSDFDALNNGGKLSIFATEACFVGGFDYEDSIMEHFIHNPNGGGIATLSNTRRGFMRIGDPYSLSAHCIMAWYKSLFKDKMYHLGEAFADSKNDNPPPDTPPAAGYEYLTERHVRWTFNLLGDPEMPVWTDTPESLYVEHLAQLRLGSSSFTVHVEKIGGGIVDQAYVCLWKDDEVYMTGYTNDDGDITFNPSPSTTGAMYVTVTKQNYLPYRGETEAREGTVLSYAPTSHNFGYKYEGENDSRTFEIWNAGTETLEYALIESCDWVIIDPPNGNSTGEHDTITIDIDTTGLSLGSYSCDTSISSNGGDGTFRVTVTVCDNIPPDKPSKPSGETSVIAGTEYEYTSTTYDSEGNDVSYWFDWGDWTSSGWTEFVPSGTEVSVLYSWNEIGTYYVKVKAKDTAGIESEWSITTIVTVEDDIPPNVKITKPERALYINNRKILPFLFFIKKPVVIGDMDIEAYASDNETGIYRVDFYSDDGWLVKMDYNPPYSYTPQKGWNILFTKFAFQVVAYDNAGNSAIDKIEWWWHVPLS